MENFSGKYTIKQIFQDNWDKYLENHPDTADYIVETIEKILACRDPEKLGYTTMACPFHSDQYVVIPHSCKSRFCNSCGKVATDKWLNKACSDFPNVKYHHITFTIPSELRPLFLSRPEVRKYLSQVSSKLVLDWCKEHGYLPAITTVLHTFGRDLKFHPHIHMLVSNGGIDLATNDQWTDKQHYLPEFMLKKRWQTLLLYRLYGKRLISHKLKRELFQMKWYVHTAFELLIAIVTTNYVGRYTKRPPLSQARILNYDGNTVTFFYEDWYYLKQKKIMTLTVEDFIARLIQHVPPKNFRLINHYGLLHNRTRSKYLPLLKKLFGKIKAVMKKTTWRIRQKLYQGKDIMLCPKCNHEMKPIELAFWSKRWKCIYIKSLF